MSKDNEKGSTTSADNSDLPNTSTTEYVYETDAQLPDSKNNTKVERQTESQQASFSLRNNQAEKANNIAVWSVIVNLLVGAFTILLFFQTRKANEIANSALIQSTKANDISKAALEDSRINDKAAKDRQEIIDAFELNKEERSRRKDSVTIDLAQRSLSNQIFFSKKSDSNFIRSIKIADSSLGISNRTLEKLQKNFETENKAMFFMGGFKSDTIKPNRINNISVTFRNFGKSPAILVDVIVGIKIDTSRILAPNKFTYNKEAVQFVNLFVPASGGHNYMINLQPISEETINEVTQKKKRIFIYGEVSYYDLVRREYSVYEFCLSLRLTGAFDVTPNHNMIREMRTVEIK